MTALAPFRRVLPLAAAAAMLLASCGTDTAAIDQVKGLRSVTAGVVAARRAPAVAPGASVAPPGLTRARLARLNRPADLITVESRAATGVVFLVGSNRGVETWASVDDKSVSLRDGVIVATRGLGSDLMAAEAPSAARIAAGGSWTRLHAALDDLDQTVSTRFDCVAAPAGPARIVIIERTYDTRLVRETCRAADGTGFTNEYWFSGQLIRQSRQWIGENVGYVAVRRLRD